MNGYAFLLYRFFFFTRFLDRRKARKRAERQENVVNLSKNGKFTDFFSRFELETDDFIAFLSVFFVFYPL